MLDKLDSVDWEKLSKTESGAVMVPILLREITSLTADWEKRSKTDPNAPYIPIHLKDKASLTDEDTLNWDLKCLYDLIVHQGMLFLHSVYVIPIILDIITYDPQLRVVMVSLLTHIAQCSPLYTEELTYGDIVAQARRELGKGIDVYLSLLPDNRPFLRQRTLELMAQLREYALQLRPSLLAMLESENDEQRATEISRTLDALA